MRLRCLENYSSAKLSTEAGSVIEVDDTLGAWLLQDAPTAFEDVNAPKKRDKKGNIVDEEPAPAGDASPDGSTGDREIPPEPDVTVVEKALDEPPVDKQVRRAQRKK